MPWLFSARVARGGNQTPISSVIRRLRPCSSRNASIARWIDILCGVRSIVRSAKTAARSSRPLSSAISINRHRMRPMTPRED
ncbi:conserved hypothetical protein [Ricinus communis]|uniref:Uncharacterized protein n=1 Tax=Ricinus communis TaxID=3988 RepID=B9TIW9_RICCO|nr:conserved hypothetical protein [Ricinus communis]